MKPLGFLLTASLVLAGCSAAAEPSPESDASADVPFTSCSEVECSGELDGAAFEIALPEQWNGTLLLWSHGYRVPQPAPPDFSPVNTSAEAAPGGTDGEVATALLADGYAIAGSAYAENGWAVTEGVAAGEALYEYFRENVGEPNRTIVWGASMGGLVTHLLAERHPDWVSGSLPACGPMAGANENFDLALDAAYAVKELIAPDLQLTGFDSWEDAVDNWQYAEAQILAATSDLTTGIPRLLVVGAITDAPTKTARFDGSTVESQVSGLVESLLTAVGFATYVRADLEERVGGNPSQNVAADYGARVSDSERQLIESVSPGSVAPALEALASGERVSADPAARAALEESGAVSGDLTDRMITVHTAADSLVLAQNQSLFAERVLTSDTRTADLLQYFTVAPATFPPPTADGGGGAPYGAGHCNFTAATYLGLVDVLNAWIRDGLTPTSASVSAAVGEESGLQLSYRPGPWPAPEATQPG